MGELEQSEERVGFDRRDFNVSLSPDMMAVVLLKRIQDTLVTTIPGKKFGAYNPVVTLL